MKTPKHILAAYAVAAFFALCCVGMFTEITHFLQARLDGPSFSTDQMIASLGVMVTGLGLFIAIAAAGIAVLTVFGISELKDIAERKAKEGLDQILEVLREKNLLDEDEFYRLQQASLLPANRIATSMPVQESNIAVNTQTAGTTGNLPNELSEYPEGKEDQTS
ncbi:hypothetical protein ACOBR2_20945 [Telmatobacter bradus]|uniref:hypothetical protein n=1 Tax=Telmatobacter bradus TaxID=474953 RepID=UPI003B437F5C